MSRDGRFWDRMAERYSKRPIDDEAAYQKKLEVTQDYFRPDMKVLEFGCGTGGTAILHAPYVAHITATDISPNMIGIARGKAGAADVKNVDFQVVGIDDFDAPDESYDAVLGMSILHLVRDRDAVIAHVHRMLKPGGVFVSNTVCISGAAKVLKYIGPVGRALGLLPRLRVFSQDQLTDSITGAGFTIDRKWSPGKGMAVFVVAKKAG